MAPLSEASKVREVDVPCDDALVIVTNFPQHHDSLTFTLRQQFTTLELLACRILVMS